MKKIYLIAFAIILTSCSKEYSQHGYNFDHNKFDTIKTGVTSKDVVVAELGSPTSRSDFGIKKFFYISNKTEGVAFLDPKIIEQKVLVISFDKNNIVSQIDELTLDDANQLMFSENKTEIRGNTLTPVEQILTNIGKFEKK